MVYAQGEPLSWADPGSRGTASENTLGEDPVTPWQRGKAGNSERGRSLTPEPIFHEPAAIYGTIMAVLLSAPCLSEHASLPGLIGLVLGGLLIGPNGFNLLAISPTIKLLRSVGLIFLMFNAGRLP